LGRSRLFKESDPNGCTYYKTNTQNKLWQFPISEAYGRIRQKMINAGRKLKNKGIEAQLNLIPFESD